VNIEWISQPAIISASSTAFLMEPTVFSILMTTPLRSPCDGWVPRPMIATPWSVISPITAATFEVPISKPATMVCFFVMTL